jgi:membrane fusion protein, multidrug efflux system
MKIVKLLFLAAPALLALALLAAHLASKNEQADDAEREAPIHKAFAITVDNGVTTLTVNNAAQARSGIQVKALAAAQAAGGPVVYGTVVDVQPLLDLSSRYAAGSAELRAAQEELGRRDAERGRIQALYDDGQNASRKALDAADADAAAAQARAAAARIAVAASAAALRQQFGPVLASWAMAPSSPDMRALAERKEVLVRVVSMAADRAAPPSLALSGAAQPVDARLVSASPQTDPGIQGQAWFYRTAAPLAVGTRLTGRVAVPAQAATRIPADAVVWYGGQPWAYVRTDGTTFERRRIAPDLPVDGGFVVSDGFTPGEAVVVQGAQLLLSEESRALLRDD